MDPDIAYFMDIMLAFISFFYVAYIVFGRIKNRALVGGYKPGRPGYDLFRKIISTKYLVISSVLAVFFVINAIFDARRVLESSYSSSVLIVAPIFTALLFWAVVSISSRLFSRK